MFAETKSFLNKFNIEISSLLMFSLRAIVICQIYFENLVISSKIHLFAPLLNMRRCTVWYNYMKMISLQNAIEKIINEIITLFSLIFQSYCAPMFCTLILFSYINVCILLFGKSHLKATVYKGHITIFSDISPIIGIKFLAIHFAFDLAFKMHIIEKNFQHSID